MLSYGMALMTEQDQIGTRNRHGPHHTWHQLFIQFDVEQRDRALRLHAPDRQCRCMMDTSHPFSRPLHPSVKEQAFSPRETIATHSWRCRDQQCSGDHQRSPPGHRQEVGEADQHPWSYTSFVQDLTIQRQALLPSCTSHSSFRRVATLGSRHGMIPTWQRSRSRSVCVCGRQSQLPLPYSFSRGVQVPMPPSLRRRSIVFKVLSAVRGCVSQRPTE